MRKVLVVLVVGVLLLSAVGAVLGVTEESSFDDFLIWTGENSPDDSGVIPCGGGHGGGGAPG